MLCRWACKSPSFLMTCDRTTARHSLDYWCKNVACSWLDIYFNDCWSARKIERADLCFALVGSWHLQQHWCSVKAHHRHHLLIDLASFQVILHMDMLSGFTWNGQEIKALLQISRLQSKVHACLVCRLNNQGNHWDVSKLSLECAWVWLAWWLKYVNHARDFFYA